MASPGNRFRHILLVLGLITGLAGATCSHHGLSTGTGGAHGGGGVIGSGGSGGNPGTVIHGDGIAPMAGGGVVGPSGAIDSQPADGADQIDAQPGGFAAESACLTLGSCDCMANPDCAPIAESCWCPTECGVVCTCGGGRYWGCAPAGLATCAGARDRLAKLCPDVAGGVTQLCESSSGECIAKCLNDFTSCHDIECAFCTVCPGCASIYHRCFDECRDATRG